MKQRVALLFSASASCTAALDARTLQLSHTAVALRRAQETVSDAEREVNALQCSTVFCLIVIPCFQSKTCSSCRSLGAVLLASQEAGTSRCVAVQLELHHAAILCLTGEQAQADERAAADAVVVCAPFVKAVFLS